MNNNLPMSLTAPDFQMFHDGQTQSLRQRFRSVMSQFSTSP